MDNKLFELCGEVWKKTEWNPSEGFRNWYRSSTVTISGEYTQAICPRYTSDYLLEKLPDHLETTPPEDKNLKWANLYLKPDGNDWWGGYIDIETSLSPYNHLYGRADTPLKALLKLTIKLHDAGELK